MQQSYSWTTRPRSDFNKVVKQFYWNHTSVWVFSCKCVLYIFRAPFPKNTSERLLLNKLWKTLQNTRESWNTRGLHKGNCQTYFFWKKLLYKIMIYWSFTRWPALMIPGTTKVTYVCSKCEICSKGVKYVQPNNKKKTERLQWHRCQCFYC